ncbi:MAG: hypothetical protein QXT27_01665 [Pyrobaculum sp.]
MGLFSKIVDNILYPLGILIGSALATGYVYLALFIVYILLTGKEIPQVSGSIFIPILYVKASLFLAMKMGQKGLKKQFYAAIFVYVISIMFVFGYLIGSNINEIVSVSLQDLVVSFFIPLSVVITVKLFDYFFEFGASNKDFDFF